MNDKQAVKLIEKLDALETQAQFLIENAQQLKSTAVALKEELSGGSDSSIIPKSHKKLILERRRKNSVKK